MALEELFILIHQYMKDDMYRRKRYDVEDCDSEDETLMSSAGWYSPDAKSAHALVDKQRASNNVDFGAVSLYVPGLQVAVALNMACTASVLSGFLTPLFACNAVRTVMITMLTGTAFILKPFQTVYARGVDIMFDALRPSVMVYVIAITCEQLLHSCRLPVEEPSSSALRYWLEALSVFAMGVAGFWQAVHPTEQTDYPFAISLSALLLISFFTPTPSQGMGPLCDLPNIPQAIERFIRTLTFAWVYISLAYARGPANHTIGEVMLCATRATSGSIWTLFCNKWVLILGGVQGLIVVFVRIKQSTSNTTNAQQQHASNSQCYNLDNYQYQCNHNEERDDQESIVSERSTTEFIHPPPEIMMSTAAINAKPHTDGSIFSNNHTTVHESVIDMQPDYDLNNTNILNGTSVEQTQSSSVARLTNLEFAKRQALASYTKQHQNNFNIFSR